MCVCVMRTSGSGVCPDDKWSSSSQFSANGAGAWQGRNSVSYCGAPTGQQVVLFLQNSLITTWLSFPSPSTYVPRRLIDHISSEDPYAPALFATKLL